MPLQNIGQRGESKFCMHERAVSPPREGVRYDVAVITVVAAAAGCRNEALH
jgi:hypothetical protein